MNLYIQCAQKQCFYDWFNRYTSEITSDDPQVRQNLDLKRTHTLRVCDEIVRLSKSLGHTPEQQNFAHVIALFHDLGRFEQYVKYGTYLDRDSVDHARLGVDILQRFGVLENIDSRTATVLRKAVLYHNQRQLPPDEDKNVLYWAQLLRDADKLDIWHIVIEYHRNGKNKNAALDLGLSEDPFVSSKVIEDLEQGTIVNSSHIRSIDDFKLLLAGWVYDLNYLPSLQQVKKRGYLRAIRASLAHYTHLDAIFDGLNGYIDQKLSA